MIEHVYDRACKSKKASEVIVATDSQKIYNAVKEFGGKVVMTSKNHKSGTDRIAEVASNIKGDIFVNVQGDEPEITGEAIDELIKIIENEKKANVATLIYPINMEDARDPNIVKVVCDINQYALYFSRSLIPYPRGNEDYEPLGHIGIYAYKRDFLLQYSNMQPSKLETIEKLEQLRILENGYNIITKITEYRSIGIDTMNDYQKFIERWQKR